MRILVVIPARYQSSRFPGKPLALIDGLPMIERVCRQVDKTGIAEKVVVATDDERIYDAVAAFGRDAMMTSPYHPSGTDRCGEVEAKLREQGDVYDVVLNVQGDEPGLPPDNLIALINAFEDPAINIATLISPVMLQQDLQNSSLVKVVCNHQEDALYFSRFPIPFQRDTEPGDDIHYYRHQGVYAFRKGVLFDICALPPGMLEKSEKLEQLRWLEHGYRIRCVTVNEGGFGIDNPADIDIFERNYRGYQDNVES